MAEESLRWWLGYRYWVLTVWYPGRFRWHLSETLPRWVAMRLPAKVAYLAFIRVYAVIGRVGPDFDEVCREWERRNA